jgi:hypothetical protein
MAPTSRFRRFLTRARRPRIPARLVDYRTSPLKPGHAQKIRQRQPEQFSGGLHPIKLARPPVYRYP